MENNIKISDKVIAEFLAEDISECFNFDYTKKIIKKYIGNSKKGI